MKLWSVLIFSSILSSCAIAQDCVWNRETEFPLEYPPLLVDLAEWQAYLPVVEDGNNVVRILEGTIVVVACPGENLVIGGEVAEGICQEGSLDIDGIPYHIRELACDNRVDDDAIIHDGMDCSNGDGILGGIGFNVVGYQFYEIIEVCFNTLTKLAIHTRHVVYGNSVAAAESNPSRPSFKMGNGFYDLNPNDCYLTANQDEYFTDLLGDPDFIDLGSNKYFSRGHLAPNADFFVEMEADATFYYINAMPQWQDYNGQNWANLELAVRNIAADHGTDLEVWTGPAGHQVMLEDTLIYHCASQASDTIPTPELIWKVVYEPSTNNGLAIVMSNIPHEGTPPIICSDLNCSSFTWISDEVFDPVDLTRGYMYCCTVQDFQTIVPGAPDLPDDVGLLQ